MKYLKVHVSQTCRGSKHPQSAEGASELFDAKAAPHTNGDHKPVTRTLTSASQPLTSVAARELLFYRTGTTETGSPLRSP